jgi:hypothetical protein
VLQQRNTGSGCSSSRSRRGRVLPRCRIDRCVRDRLRRHRGASRDVIKDDFGGKLPSGRPFRSDVRGYRSNVRPRPRLPRGWVFTVRRRGKKRVRADAGVRPRGRPCPGGRSPTSVRTHLPPLPPSPPLSLPPLCCPRGRENKIKKNKIKKFGSCCRLEKREIFFNYRFSVFNPQNPQTPQTP